MPPSLRQIKKPKTPAARSDDGNSAAGWSPSLSDPGRPEGPSPGSRPAPAGLFAHVQPAGEARGPDFDLPFNEPQVPSLSTRRLCSRTSPEMINGGAASVMARTTSSRTGSGAAPVVASTASTCTARTPTSWLLATSTSRAATRSRTTASSASWTSHSSSVGWRLPGTRRERGAHQRPRGGPRRHPWSWMPATTSTSRTRPWTAPTARTPRRTPETASARPSQTSSGKKLADDDWTSQHGPRKGLKFRGGAPPLPPTWHYDKGDLKAYRKWEKRVRIWEL